MARYEQAFKNKVLAKLLPPNTASLEEVSQEVGVSVDTLQRWRSESLSTPARQRAWSAPARLNAVITTAAMDEASRSAWCRENGLTCAETAGSIQIISWRDKPQVIRCDNGPLYISGAIQNWAAEWGIRLEHIQPGNPQQNAYVERFNRAVRYEWLSQYLWKDLAQVQDFATQWMWSYNHDRPNMALGGFTPKQRLAMAA